MVFYSLLKLFQRSNLSVSKLSAAVTSVSSRSGRPRPSKPRQPIDGDKRSQSESQERMVNRSTDKSSALNFDYSKYVSLDGHGAIKVADLECSLCYRLLYHPATTPCGHTFCLKCLERALDHRDQCPLCKYSLADYLAERRQFVTGFVDKLIRVHFAAEHQERKRQHREELAELVADENEIGVFVCTLAMPFVPCPLHVYEPRYRLMVRRAIETGRRSFGMVMYSERTPYRFAEYGTMLDIRTCQFLRDGRSILTTVGSRRFRVLSSTTRDGYNVAKVEWVKDTPVSDETEKAGKFTFLTLSLFI